MCIWCDKVCFLKIGKYLDFHSTILSCHWNKSIPFDEIFTNVQQNVCSWINIHPCLLDNNVDWWVGQCRGRNSSCKVDHWAPWNIWNIKSLIKPLKVFNFLSFMFEHTFCHKYVGVRGKFNNFEIKCLKY